MEYKVAHSPDADDIFMYYAIKFGWVDTADLSLKNIALDIETLNREALANTYDATAISFALYPKIKDEYALLRTATSFGEGYGPKLIKKRGVKLKRNFKVALSGENTTNALIFRAKYKDARVVYKNFLEIEGAVLSGEVDAGVLIHESILNYASELECEAEIYDLWLDLSGAPLPLPLGGMALRRSLPLNRAIMLEQILAKAVALGVKNARVLSAMLLERSLVRVSSDELAKYLDLYANASSVDLSPLQIEAVDRLFAIGYEHGFYKDAIRAQDYFIPREYADLRNS